MMLFQVLADGILTGSIIALGAIGLTLTMSVLHFPNFAHAELITFGADIALAALGLTGAFTGPLAPLSFGLPLVLAGLVAMAAAVVLALLVDRLVYRKLRARAKKMSVVFGSFGVSLLVRMSILMIFGGAATYYSTALQRAVSVGGLFRVMPDQVFTLGVTVIIVIGLHLFLKHARLGLAMRAYAENPQLAGVYGCDSERVLRWTWIIGAALAALAGVLYGLTVQIRPEIGFQLLLPLFAAAIMGGVGNVYGAVLGGLIVGLAESLSIYVIPPGYKMAVPFLLLLLILYLRPTGLFGAAKGAVK
ncbi:MAG: branched-chain amino acid ABC transporter permease [Gemmobacter sp.]|jgi:branched-chain amino acid transport system permease protein|nr:branched-chain amino acid ABC transporter permease [Gemmobacter sp.]